MRSSNRRELCIIVLTRQDWSRSSIRCPLVLELDGSPLIAPVKSIPAILRVPIRWAQHRVSAFSESDGAQIERSARPVTWLGILRTGLGSAWVILSILNAVPAIAADRSPETATLTIHVCNVAPEGTVRLGLYTEMTYPDDKAKPVASADVPARAEETIVELHDIPPGAYAIKTYQDLNNNGKMDRTWIGLPEEPYGFSRDAQPFMTKPGFDSVKFEAGPGRSDLVIHLQNTSAGPSCRS